MYRDINNQGDLDLRKELELGVRAIQGRQGNPSDGSGSERFQKRPEERQTNPFTGVRAQRRSLAPMVTFSPGRLPAGPNKGKTQTAPQASEVFILCKHQARAAGGSRAPRAWAEGSQ